MIQFIKEVLSTVVAVLFLGVMLLVPASIIKLCLGYLFGL